MIDLDRLKQSLNIVDVIDKYVPLKKAGKNYQACCPFHDEKSPSFTVNESKQFYHCFGCGEHGSVIDFVMNYMNMEMIDAAKFLGGESEEPATVNVKRSIQKARLRLPLNGQPQNMEEMSEFIKSKCEMINGCAFYGSNQVLFTTDIHSNAVSLVMISSKYEAPRHYKKQFIYGSCVVMGEVKENAITHLCDDYFDALSVYKNTGETVICFFDVLNLHFIVEDLKRKTTNLIVVTSNDEVRKKADDLNLIDCRYYGGK